MVMLNNLYETLSPADRLRCSIFSVDITLTDLGFTQWMEVGGCRNAVGTPGERYDGMMAWDGC